MNGYATKMRIILVDYVFKLENISQAIIEIERKTDGRLRFKITSKTRTLSPSVINTENIIMSKQKIYRKTFWKRY